ncbi:unnamed protein product [Adineta ricciae]|uniref:Riboflavin transporter n=1 Tax=Adineta ricciae TaxID=249248 RepID=A0A813WM68_ADIRI|nr:unnamed protein product [Adineta ricciae]CAF1453130.1 unnamed protein product [Adineta ricciae]
MIPNVAIADSIESNNSVLQPSKMRTAQLICFGLIAVMNLSSWIDLYGVFTELPLIIPLAPEGWALPSMMLVCNCIANLLPVIVVFLRWYQGKKFSEIPYIYLIITIGIVSCFLLSLLWHKTVYLFGRERSVWLIGLVFTISLLDNTSSLVFFDYMKRFRGLYLTAAFLGEGFTGTIPTVLLLLQGIGGEAICVRTSNDTLLKPTFTEPRFSVRVYMFVITGIIVASLLAFLLLRWTNIISLADAAEPANCSEETELDIVLNEEEKSAIISTNGSVQSPIAIVSKQTTEKTFLFLLCINVVNSLVVYGILPSLITYIILPYGQKALYYSTFLNTIGYTMVLVFSIRHPHLSIISTIVASIFSYIIAIFLIVIATQSPCPWWADTIHGGFIIIFSDLIMALITGYVRITIGNRIKDQWSNKNGLFYFGISVQLGSTLGAVPTFLMINVFDLFVAREPCHVYCIT